MYQQRTKRFHFTNFRQSAWKKQHGQRGLRKEIPYVKGQISEDEAFDNGNEIAVAQPRALRPHGLRQILHGMADDVPVLFWFEIIGLIGPVFVGPSNVSRAHAVRTCGD